MSKKVQETVTKMLIERVQARRDAGENVVAPWRKLWNPLLGADRNLISGKAYRGGNIFMTAIQGYASPFWITAKQAAAAGGQINTESIERKGEMVTVKVPYTPIVHWHFPTKEEEARGRFPSCKFYQVWNIEQTTGLDALVEAATDEYDGAPLEPIAEAQAIVDGWHGCPPIVEGSARACYNPSADRISVPSLAAFASGGGQAEDYYHTLFHEMGHATGHRTREARDGVVNPVRFASHDYSAEELIAEMTAGILSAHAGINTEEVDSNSAAYLDHWLKVLKAEPDMLMKSGGKAQRAADMIRGISWKKAEKASK